MNAKPIACKTSRYQDEDGGQTLTIVSPKTGAKLVLYVSEGDIGASLWAAIEPRLPRWDVMECDECRAAGVVHFTVAELKALAGRGYVEAA